MKRSASQCSLAVIVLLASVAAWAQDSGLPALPPGMEGSASSSDVQLPPPPVAEEPAPAAVDPMPGPGMVSVPPVENNNVQQPVPMQDTTNVPSALPSTTSQDVTTLTTPVPSPETSAKNAPPPVPQEAVATPKKDFKPSYGEFSQSLFYAPDDIERMKKVLYMYEQVQRPEGTVAVVKDEFTDLLDDVKPIASIQEPEKYPSFYLSSIVYRGPNDWLIWLNGEKYSPKKEPTEVKIVRVTGRTATFEWAPVYMQSAKARLKQMKIDRTIPKHYKAPGANMQYNDEKFVFTLAPNQSFVSAAFGVFEGKYTDRPVPTMQQVVQIDEIIPDNAPAGQLRDPDAELKNTMKQLQRVNSNLTKLTPRNRVNNDPAMTPPSAPFPTN